MMRRRRKWRAYLEGKEGRVEHEALPSDVSRMMRAGERGREHVSSTANRMQGNGHVLSGQQVREAVVRR